MNKNLNYITTIVFLSPYIKKFKSNFFIFYLGWLFDLILSLVIPIIFGIMIDEIVYYQNLTTFIQLSIVFVVMTVLSCLLYFFIYAQHHYIMSMFVFDIKKDVFNHYQKCNAKAMTAMKSGEVITLLQKYSKECMHFVIRNVVHFINCIICIVYLSIYLFMLNWKFGIIVLLLTPFTIFINTKYGSKIRKNGEKQRKLYNNYIGWVFEILSSLKDIQLLGAKKLVFRKFTVMQKEMFNWSNQASLINIFADFLIQFVNLLAQLIIYIFSGYLAYKGHLTIGSLTVVLSFYNLLKDTMKRGSSNFLDAQMRISYIQQIYNFMQVPEEEAEWSGTHKLALNTGEIKFNNVSFGYEDKYVLKNIDFSIKPNEKIALVGKSGAGKSTLAYMLVAFYKPLEGYIQIDNQNLNDCTLKSIRKQIGLIQQDVLLFDGTIKENLLLGNSKATNGELMYACQNAGIWDFINTLPNGLETNLGAGGISLSGGQRQRLAIARIYLKNPKIIIFDESTSALDSETEEQIIAEWSKMLRNRTAIIIAHRITSVMMCDRVAIIENGTICETGKPEYLQKNSKRFVELFEGSEINAK